MDVVVVVYEPPSDATALRQGVDLLPTAEYTILDVRSLPTGLLLEVVRFAVGAARPGQVVYVRHVRAKASAGIVAQAEALARSAADKQGIRVEIAGQ